MSRTSRATRVTTIGALLLTLVATSASGQTKYRRRFVKVPTVATSQLLIANLSNGGCWLGPYTDSGSYTGVNGPHPLARRQSDKMWFILSGNGHVYKFAEPSPTTPCPADLTTLTPVAVSTQSCAGGVVPCDMGLFPAFDASGGHFPGGGGASYPFGSYFDDARGWLCYSWTGTYSGVAQANSWGCASVGDSSFTIIGCWYTSNSDTNQESTGSNILDLPASFLSTYGLTAGSKAIGDGGELGTINTGMSMGPSLVALPWPPISNSCSGGIDRNAGAGTTLVHYEINQIGPTCGTTGTAGPNIGCSKTGVDLNGSYVAPTSPSPAKTSNMAYSMESYKEDWDPYPAVTPTTGYVIKSFVKTVIYNDEGVKSGYLNFFTMPEGWLRGTVLASPAPTVSYPDITFSMSVQTQGATAPRQGDLLWAQTCVTGGTDGAGCEDVNNKYISFAIIDTYNAGTGAVTAHITVTDCGGVDCGNSTGSTTGHKPIVGGPVYMGYVYAHGGPTDSRSTGRLQIYALSQLGEVKNGTRAKDTVTYNEDVDFSTLLPGFGSVFSTKFDNGSELKRSPYAVIADPARHQILIALGGGKSQGSVDSAPIIHVLNVASTP